MDYFSEEFCRKCSLLDQWFFQEIKIGFPLGGWRWIVLTEKVWKCDYLINEQTYVRRGAKCNKPSVVISIVVVVVVVSVSSIPKSIRSRQIWLFLEKSSFYVSRRIRLGIQLSTDIENLFYPSVCQYIVHYFDIQLHPLHMVLFEELYFQKKNINKKLAMVLDILISQFVVNAL